MSQTPFGSKEDNAKYRKLVRQANRLQVLVELVKATADSVADGLVVTPSGVSGDGESAEALTTSQEAGAGSRPTRGTLQGIADRIEDGIESGDATRALAAVRELRGIVDVLTI